MKNKAEELFLQVPSEDLVNDVLKAIETKKEKDADSVCDVEIVSDIIKVLRRENNETILDAMVTSAMLLPTPILMFAIDKLKDLVSFKMLQDLRHLAGSDFDIDDDLLKKSKEVEELEELAKKLKDLN